MNLNWERGGPLKDVNIKKNSPKLQVDPLFTSGEISGVRKVGCE